MNPSDVISAGDALGKLGVVGLLSVYAIAVSLLLFRVWRDGKADQKEAADTYIAMLKEQFSDANRRKDLFDEIGKAIDGQAQAIRDLRQEVSNLQQRLRS